MNPKTTPSFSRKLEAATLAHLSVFLVGVSWAFGGNADWVRTPICLWGLVGCLLTAVILVNGAASRGLVRGALAWMIPVVLLNAVVGISCLSPGLRSLGSDTGSFLMAIHVPWWKPTSARPEASLGALLLFDGIYFSCLNIALSVRSRHAIRVLLAIAVANALALAILGTIQKLVGSTGIYFGAVKSPQVHFFASFVYDNHWGAFVILMVGACTGLVIRYAFGTHGDGFFRGPALAGLVAAALLSLAVPLSGARACTLLLCALVLVALARGVPQVAKALKLSGVSYTGALGGILAALALALAGIWMIAGDVIGARAQSTKEQIAVAWAQGSIGSRTILYHDTIRMAGERPLFGWGMGSYPTVFLLYNTQESKHDHLPVIYHDAHSDWLQSLAELGVVGTALIGAAIVIPAASVRRLRVSPIAFFLIVGCVLVGAYAWVEFPFGNVAVVLSWWLCYISAIQYMRLSGPSGGSTPPA